MRRSKPRANANLSKRRKLAHKRKKKAERERRASNAGRSGARRACSRKKRSPTREDAIIRAERLMNTKGVRLRVYHCPYCGGWHLTSKFRDESSTDGDGAKGHNM